MVSIIMTKRNDSFMIMPYGAYMNQIIGTKANFLQSDIFFVFVRVMVGEIWRLEVKY